MVLIIQLEATGRYGITAAMMTLFANTLLDMMRQKNENGEIFYSGQVDGKTGGTGNSRDTDNIRSGYLFLAEFRPDDYREMMEGARLKEGGATGSIDAFSRFAWVKNQRDKLASNLNS